jgi:phosphoribosylglycinamide formyltransferase-1
MKKFKAAVLISGRGSNMEALIRSASDGDLRDICEIALVISNRDNAGGIDAARKLNVNVVVIPSTGRTREWFEDAVLRECAAHHIEFVFLAGFDRILSPMFINKYRSRIINIHPADTRQYQGLHGYQWAFDNRLGRTMITVHLVDEGVDTGTVIGKREVDLSGATTVEEVMNRGLRVEHALYSEAVAGYLRQFNNQEFSETN